MYLTLSIVLTVLTAMAAFVLRSYNALRKTMENLKESLSNISVVTSKKISMVNQLITIVQSYQESEKFVMLQVSSDTVQGMQEAAARSGSVIADIGRVAQKFPELRANQQYGQLMGALQVAEHEVQNARMTYNHHAKVFNTTRTSVPTIFYANALGFGEAQYLSIGTAEDPTLKVQRTMLSADGGRVNELLSGKALASQVGAKHLGNTRSAAAAGTAALTAASAPPAAFCSQCGARSESTGNFCGDCGAKL